MNVEDCHLVSKQFIVVLRLVLKGQDFEVQPINSYFAETLLILLSAFHDLFTIYSIDGAAQFCFNPSLILKQSYEYLYLFCKF